ncbi:glycosyltransferase family 4 protein [Mucilaginibacter sp. AW1-3]
MKFVFASYVTTPEFKSPLTWLKRINIYTGILEALSKKHEVISIEHIDYTGQTFHNGVNYLFTKFAKTERHFPLAMHRFIKRQKPDVVFIQGLNNPLQVIQLRLTLGPRIPIMVQNHAEKPFTGFKKQLQRLADRGVNATLFASYAMGAEWVTKGNLTSPQKIHEVMEVSSVFYPVDKASAKARTGATGTPVFLWVGRLDQNKDPLTVVSAFLRFTDSSPDARLYMIYHTEELLDEIKALLNQHPNGNTVGLIGRIPHDDLLYWYNSADFIVAGSYYEGSGTAVCEAMSCGCIPIITDIFSFRSMTDNGRVGLLYEAGNQQQLLTTLFKSHYYLNIPAEREKVLAFFRSTLSFEAIAKRFEEIAASL